MAELILNGDPQNLYGQSVTIKQGASESELVPTRGYALCTVFVPSNWTAADVAVRTCLSIGGPSLAVANNLKTSNATAGAVTMFPSQDAVFSPYISIQSVDDTGAAVVQTQTVTLQLLFREFVQ